MKNHQKQTEQKRAERPFKGSKRNKVYDSTPYNFSKPNLDTREAAAYLGCSPYTLRLSRTTGLLYGVVAPSFKKRGRSIVYARQRLDEWDRQFEEKTNTAQEVA